MSTNMTKKFFKTICAFCAMVLLVLSFAGCGGTQSTDNNASSAAGGGSTAAVSTAPELPVIDVEVCIYAAKLDNPDAMKQDRIIKYINDKFKINLKLVSNPYESAGQKALLAFTSGVVSDYYLIPAWTDEGKNILNKSINEDIFTNIGDMVAKDPQRYNVLNKMFEDPLYKMYNDIKFGDSNRYVCTWAINCSKTAFAAPCFNMKYLNKLGLKLPVTTDDFINILRAIKNGDPDGNGKKDTIPWCPTTFKASIPGYEISDIFFSTLGACAYSWVYVPDDKGTFLDTSTSEGFKTAMKLVAGMYKEGLIDKELFTKEVYANVDDLASGKTAVGTFAAPNSYGSMYDYAWRAFKKANPDAVYTDLQFPAKPLTGPNGPMEYWYSTLSIGDAGIIPKGCKNPERVLDLVNWIFSTEGQTVAHYGIEGVHYTKGSDGTIKVNVEELAKDTNKIYNPGNDSYLMWGIFAIFINGYSKFTDIEKYGWYNAARNAFLPMNEDGRIPVDDVKKYEQDITKSWESITVELPAYVSFVNFSEAEMKLKTKVEDIKNQWFMKFMVGEKDVDKDWDTYVKELTDTGATALVNSYNEKILAAKKTYEKYMGAK